MDIAEIVAWRQGAQCKKPTQMLTLHFARVVCKAMLLVETDTIQFKRREDLFTLVASLQDLLHNSLIVKWLLYWCSLTIDSLA